MRRWEERIQEASERRFLGIVCWPRFTKDERVLASKWTTCAVGEIRRRYGIKMDRAFWTLGTEFYKAVRWNRVRRAAELRDSIEEYALAVKRCAWERDRAPAPHRADGPPAGGTVALRCSRDRLHPRDAGRVRREQGDLTLESPQQTS